MLENEERDSLLALERISHKFRNEKGREIEVLKNVSLTVHEGEIVALLGPSGCGKTTTLRIMAGLLEPTDGRVLVHGLPLQDVNDRIGLVFQNYALLPWYTVEQNVALGLRHGLTAKQRKVRVSEAVDLVGLGGFEEAYPRELSGGMRQRVGIARALAMRPEILCLDEPFSAVDLLTAETMRSEVIDLWRDKSETLRSVVMVTHDIYEAAMMAQRIIVLGAEPGHIRTVLTNNLPYPRDAKHPRLLELIDVIHAVITEALIPEVAERPRYAQQPAWYQGLENLPQVSPSEIIGLLEVLEDHGGKVDIFQLANETESEFGHCLAVTKTAELLDFVDTPKQTVTFTDLGKRFVRSDTAERKELFSAQVRGLRVFQTLLSWLDEVPEPEKEIEREQVLAKLHAYFPNENLDRLFDTLVAFGRYAEILSYNAKTGRLTFPKEEEPDDSDSADLAEAEEGGGDGPNT